MKCQICGGQIEANATVFLDVEAEGETITRLTPSRLNDQLDGHPMALESELEIACESGHPFEWVRFSDELRGRITGQQQRITEDGTGALRTKPTYEQLLELAENVSMGNSEYDSLQGHAERLLNPGLFASTDKKEARDARLRRQERARRHA